MKPEALVNDKKVKSDRDLRTAEQVRETLLRAIE